MKIKWTNKNSQETGYVKAVNTKEQHFENTFDYNDAKDYKLASVAKGIITKLISYGEGENNSFDIVE